MLPFDLDAVGLSVQDVSDIINRAFIGLRRLVWTTWSCKDGYASVRVVLLLAAPTTFEDACRAWWWGRRKLIDAGLPLDSVKPGEPSCDSRAMDGRLFYLPSHPASRIAGEGDWGGVPPARGCGEAADTLLDLAPILSEAETVMAVDKPSHRARWPSLPVPGDIAAKMRRASKVRDTTTGKGSGAASWANVTVDFSQVLHPTAGVDLLTWTRGNVPVGSEFSPIGNPWQVEPRRAGETYLDGSSCVLRHDADGRVWLRSWKLNTSFWHRDGFPEGFERRPPGSSRCPSAAATKGGRTEAAEAENAVSLKGVRGGRTNGVNNNRRDHCATPPSGVENTSRNSLMRDLEAVGGLRVYRADELVEGRYLPYEPLRARLTGFHADKGTGKTEVIRRAIDAVRASGATGSVLVISHRQTIAQQAAQRFQVICYLDPGVPRRVEGDLAVCLDSVLRIVSCTTTPDGTVVPIRPALVVLDEFTQALRHLFSATLSGPQSEAVHRQLRGLCENAEQVVIADADLDPWSFRLARELLGIDPDDARDQELRCLPAIPMFTYRVDSVRALTDRDLLLDWAAGKRLVVHCQSKRQSTVKGTQLKDPPMDVGWLRDELLRVRPEASVLLINSTTVRADPRVKAFLNDPLIPYDALIYTATLGSGFSITVRDHYDQIYVYSAEGVGTVHDLLQAAHRVRHPRSTEVRIHCPPGQRGTRETDPQRIYDGLLAAGDTTVRVLSPDGVVTVQQHVVDEIVYHDGAAVRDPWRTDHNRLYAEVLSYERRTGGPGGDRRWALLAYLRGQGAGVTETEDAATLEASGVLDQSQRREVTKFHKDTAARVREAEARRIWSARDLMHTEADALDGTDLSPEDADAIRKYRARELLGPGVTVNEVADTKLASRVRAFAKYRAFVTDPDAVKAMDRRERSQGVPASHASFSYLHCVAWGDILNAAGLPRDPTIWGAATEVHTDGRVAAYAKRHRRILETLGIVVRADIDRDQIRLVRVTLEHFGVELRESKVGGQRRFYVAGAQADHALRWSEHRTQHILHPDREGRPKAFSDLTDEAMAQLEAVLDATSPVAVTLAS